MIRRDWLRYYDAVPERTYKTKVIQSWDTAAKDGAQNDWSVCTTWLDDRFHETSHGTDDLIADSLFCDWQNEELGHGRMAASSRIDDDRRGD
jgi:phage terminase large subunit-like protein